jgi:DNA polymerase I-like protein with 3'-5' exonuclease and polymerase domains
MYEIGQRTEWLKAVIGHDLNPKSPKQMQAFFYSDCKLPVQRSRKGIRGITCDDEALEKLSLIEPVVAPVCNVIRELRTLGVFLSTFVLAGLSFDKRIRSSFNPAGTETFRFSSSKDAFDSGCNLQNIPRIPNEEDPDVPSTKLILPNIRKLFLPDPSHTIFDVDLAGADAQVVAWDAEDEGLKAIFRSGQKLHAVNAKDIFGGDAGVDGRTEPYYTRAKTGVHLTNYGGKARTCAVALGITIHEAERFQRRWFDLHPAIKAWHDYIENELQTKRQVSNKFGYRRFYFDRVENLLPEALAWIPQSTVAIVTNKQWVKIENAIPEIGILMQVHDSLVGQVATPLWAGVKPRLKEELRVIIPYADPLIIQSGLKTSTESWGAAQEEKW